MKFVCERCHTKYSIADEKVRGKVLKVRCKTCANVITVRETGAAIDDMGGGPREAPIARSGSFDAGQAAATVIAPPAARLRHAAGLPAAALVAPGSPAAAPPVRRPTPAPPPVDNVEWYLAVEGTQTGPFTRGRLIDKVLATPKDADVHVWNADLDAWKPPKDVPEIHADLTRRRRLPTPVPPPPLRRPTGPLPVAAAPAGLSGATGAVGFGLFDASPDAVNLPVPSPKKNGVGPGIAAGAAQNALSSFGLGDLLDEGEGRATPPPMTARGSTSAGAVRAPDHAAMLTPAPFLAPGPSPLAAPAAMRGVAQAPKGQGKGLGQGKSKQVRLMLAAFTVVLVLCGIVAFGMLRRPMAPAPSGSASTGPAPTDFAGMAEKLAQEEQAAKALAKLTGPPPPLVVETKPLVAQVEAPQKGGKGKGRNNKKNQSTAPPPLGATSPATSSGSLTAEQRAAANRFGDSTGRDVRLSTATAGGARSTPAQADISRVISNNRQGIQTCYQRALLRDNTLTHGKVTVRVSIGMSGKVKSVNLDAPAQFRALEPCIRDVMSRWAFPPSSEEYGTEFPVVLQGNQ